MYFPAKSHNLHPSIHCICSECVRIWIEPRMTANMNSIGRTSHISTHTHMQLRKINSKQTTQNKRKIVFTNKADTSVIWDNRRGTVADYCLLYSHQTLAFDICIFVWTMYWFLTVMYQAQRMKWMWLKPQYCRPIDEPEVKLQFDTIFFCGNRALVFLWFFKKVSKKIHTYFCICLFG